MFGLDKIVINRNVFFAIASLILKAIASNLLQKDSDLFTNPKQSL